MQNSITFLIWYLAAPWPTLVRFLREQPPLCLSLWFINVGRKGLWETHKEVWPLSLAEHVDLDGEPSDTFATLQLASLLSSNISLIFLL